MSREQLREAIVGPAEVFGAEVESVLLTRLLNECSNTPDDLPLLQHVLLRMWLAAAEQVQESYRNEFTRAPRQITLTEHYLPTGGVSHSLDKHATELYEGLTPFHQTIAERLFRCLAERTPQGQVVRRLTSIQEIAGVTGITPEPIKEVIELVEAFRQPCVSFLMTSPEGELNVQTNIDVSHESILRQWELLQEWIEAEVDAADGYRRLIDAVDHNERSIEGIRLNLAVKWLNSVHRPRFGRDATIGP